MAETAEQMEGRMTVTVHAPSDPTSNLWFVTGPFWDDGKPGAAMGAPSFILDGKEEAMEQAEDLKAMGGDCIIRVYD